MKKIYLLWFAIVVLCYTSFAQAGNLDSTYGNYGQMITDVPDQPDYLYSGKLQPDGKIIATGSSGYPSESTLIRYKTNGRLDFTFGTNGVSVFKIDTKASEIYAVALQQNGKIVTTGYLGDFNHTSLSVLRFKNNGSIDSTFGKDGVAIIDVPKNKLSGTGIVVQPDGKIVVAGSLSIGSVDDPKSGIVVARFKTNGQPDSSFNNTGIKFLKPAKFCNASAIALSNNGKILVAGYAYNYPNPDNIIKFSVVELTNTGQQDLSFGKDGVASAPFDAQDYAIVNAMVVQPNGKIILGGALEDNYAAPTDFALVRFTKNGVIDSSFGVNGVTQTIFGGFDIVNSLAIQTDGKIIAAGESKVLGGGDRPDYFALARYNINGKPDSTFGSEGKVTTSFKNFGNRQYAYAEKVLLQPDNKIIALGDANIKQFNKSVFALARYVNDGMAIAQANRPDIELEKNIKISPNPVSDLLHVYGLNANTSTKLTITDRTGNVFKKIAVTGENYTWNLAGLKSGYYYLLAENNYGKAYVSFFKQ